MDWRGSETQSCQAKAADAADVLRAIVIKLQKRVCQGKSESSNPIDQSESRLNEEVDIRAEMGRMKEEQEKTWSEPTNRTIYQWSEVCKTKTGTFEKGAEKWRKEHIPRKGKGDISEEGQELLEDKDKWWDKTSLLKE